MGALIRRITLGALGVVVLLAACTDTVGPDAREARLIVQPSFAEMPAGNPAQNPARFVDNIRILITNMAGEVVVDQVVEWPLDQDTLRLDVVVEVTGTQSFDLEIQGRIGTQIMFRAGPLRLQLTGGAAAPAQVAPVLEYAGPEASVTALDIRGAPDTFVAGSTVSLSAFGTLGDGSQMSDPLVEWTSADPEAATVSEDGVVQVRHDAARTVSITGRVLYTDVTATVTGPIAPAGIGVSVDHATLTAVGEEATVVASVLGADGGDVTNAPVAWESRSPDVVAVVDGATAAQARVRATGSGSAWIVASSGSVMDSVAVTVRQTVARLEVQPDAVTFEAFGETAQATAAAFDANDTPIPDPDVDWDSRDGGVAIVDADGLITAIGQGSAWIVATSGSGSDSLAVTVQQTIASVEIQPVVDSVGVGGIIAFDANAVDRNGHPIPDVAFTWSSSEPVIASVQQTGPASAVATGLQPGTALISATSGAHSATATMVVVDMAPPPPVGGDVGYYNLSFGQGVNHQIPPIETAGGEPIHLDDLEAEDLAEVGVLFAENPNNGGYASSYLARLQSIEAWVEAGGVLIFHDRHVTNAAGILPGGANIAMVRNLDTDIDVRDGSTIVTDGPGGVVTDETLDGGNYSHHGYAVAESLPANAVMILSTGEADEVVTFAYPHGNGWVIYSTIPLDFYLAGSNPQAFREIYAPNVVAYGMQLGGAPAALMAERAVRQAPAYPRALRVMPGAVQREENSAVRDW